MDVGGDGSVNAGEFYMAVQKNPHIKSALQLEGLSTKEVLAQFHSADTNADGVLGDEFDCSDNVRVLDAQPQAIPCMADPCTISECCTTMPAGASAG